MKVYKTKVFDKWSKKEGITDACLFEAIDELLNGLIDAELGGGLIKKRMAKIGQGKRGSYRTLLAFKHGSRAFFLTGFSKNETENISLDEKIVLKKLCAIYLSTSSNELEQLCKLKKLIEVHYDTK